MEYAKVIEWVDIQAPREEVFALVTNIERRMQLSPLWGIAAIDEKRPVNYPQPGSTYQVRHKPVEVEEGAPSPAPVVYQTVVTEYDPPRKFSYCLDVDQLTTVTWNLAEIAAGTRLTYTEDYVIDPENAEAFNSAVREVVKNWMKNIKNYAELRDGRLKRFVRWVLDKFYLKMAPDQRKVVAIILVMHITGMIAFIMAALAMGVASLFM